MKGVTDSRGCISVRLLLAMMMLPFLASVRVLATGGIPGCGILCTVPTATGLPSSPRLRAP